MADQRVPDVTCDVVGLHLHTPPLRGNFNGNFDGQDGITSHVHIHFTLGPLLMSSHWQVACESHCQCLVTSGIHLISCPMVSLVNKTAWNSRMVPVVIGQRLDEILMYNRHSHRPLLKISYRSCLSGSQPRNLRPCSLRPFSTSR
jgi:hypothetical protein